MTASAKLTDPLMASSEPDRWWTSANTAEAMQGVLTPLDFTFQSRGIELGGRRSWRDFGVLRQRDVYLPTDANDSFMGAFYGRIGINVTFSAALFDRLPGASGSDIEMALLGFAREGITYPGTDRRRVAFIAAGSQLVKRTQGRRLADAEVSYRAWWSASTARIARREIDGRTALVEASDRFDEAMYLHLRTRFMLILAQATLGRALAEAGMPDALQPLTGAVGTAESRVAEDLWSVSRGSLSLDDFVARHGYHGPNEGTLSSPSWRADRRPLELAVASLAGQPESESPTARRERAVVRRGELEQRFVAAARRAKKAMALVRFAQQVTGWTEQGKLLTLLALDVGRAAAARHGEELAGAGTLGSSDDVYYLTIDEHRAGLTADASDVVAFRRRQRDEYLGYDIPLTWSGNPEPIRLDAIDAPEEGVLTGIGCNDGVYEGRACVVTHPATDAMEPGDVLVCNVTDPSWLGAFVVAGAVVVDIGGPTSHGAIVAREFGLPCVMGTGTGTRRLRTGDRVRVDGAAGTVEVLS